MESSGTPVCKQLCDVNNSILIMIDIQTKLGAVMPKKVLARVIENTVFLLRSANLLNIPVIATAQYPKGLGEYVDDIRVQLPTSTQHIQKTSFSCCGSDEFIDMLEKSGKKQVILAGMEAHICIFQTAVELQERGFEVFTVSDSVCSRRLDNYQNALERLGRLGINLTNAESVVFEWLRDSKNENFREISGWLR